MNRLKRVKLRTKIALFYAALFIALVTAAGIAVFHIVEVRQMAAQDDNLVDHCAGLWAYFRFQQGKPSLVYDTRNPQSAYFVRDATRYYQLYDASDGTLLLESEDSALMRLALTPSEALRKVADPIVEQRTIRGVPLRFRSAVFGNNGHDYLLRVAVSMEQQLDNLYELRRVLWLLLPVATLVAVLGAWWIAGRSLRPLQDLENEARSISIDQLHRRLPLRGTQDELDALAATFNQTLARLETAVRRIRQFSATMSHELRTPLTVLQGEAQVALMEENLPESCRTVLASQLEEFAKLKHMINGVLTLTRAEAGEIPLEKHEFDVSELALSISQQMQRLASARGVLIQSNCPNPVPIHGDVAWLERVIANLVDNAIKFTPAGGSVQIVSSIAGGCAVVEISDTGIGISEEALPHIFDPFYQAGDHDAKATEGAGLGLALAEWVVEAHGGRVEVTSQVGAGTRFRVCLPLNASR